MVHIKYDMGWMHGKKCASKVLEEEKRHNRAYVEAEWCLEMFIPWLALTPRDCALWSQL